MVTCPRFGKDHRAEWEENGVDADMRMWPCSLICTAAYEIQHNKNIHNQIDENDHMYAFMSDELLMKYTLEDKDWNNLAKTDILEIKNHEVFLKFGKTCDSPFCEFNCYDGSPTVT